jgi:hypothetical protein
MREKKKETLTKAIDSKTMVCYDDSKFLRRKGERQQLQLLALWGRPE